VKATKEQRIAFAVGFMPGLFTKCSEQLKLLLGTPLQLTPSTGRGPFRISAGIVRMDVQLSPETINEPPDALIIKLQEDDDGFGDALVDEEMRRGVVPEQVDLIELDDKLNSIWQDEGGKKLRGEELPLYVVGQFMKYVSTS
jgi:hypothetical protein